MSCKRGLREIKSTDGPRSFTVSLADGRIIRRHINHIRRHYSDSKVEVDLTPAVEFPPKEINKPEESDASSPQKKNSTEQPTVSEPTDSSDDPPTPPPRRNPPRNRKPPSRFGDYVRSN